MNRLFHIEEDEQVNTYNVMIDDTTIGRITKVGYSKQYVFIPIVKVSLNSDQLEQVYSKLILLDIQANLGKDDG